MGIKKLINSVVGMSGYQFGRVPSVALDISRGHYEWLRSRNIRTVLDVGANTGQFAMMIREVLPGAAIYSFEPLEEAFSKLLLTGRQLGNMHCMQMALGERSGEADMHRNAALASSSLLPIGTRHLKAFPHATEATRETVRIRSLDEVCSSLTLEKNILLKLDTQGYELAVLKGAGTTLQQVDTIIVEASFVPLYQDQPLFHDIYDFLHSRSFDYHGSLEKAIDPSNGEVLWEDALFRRTSA